MGSTQLLAAPDSGRDGRTRQGREGRREAMAATAVIP